MRHRVLLLVTVVLLSSVALADDPPGRVARLNYMSGQVSLQPGGVNEWVAGTINRPLTTSDRVWTDRDSRAELQLGGASVRLDSETSLTLANVSDNTVQLQLDQGTLNLHVMRLFDGEVYEIDTPNLAFTIEKAGDYRLDVDNAGDTTIVTVWNGKGVATGDNPGVRIGKNQQFTFTGRRSLQYAMTNAPGFDGFDSWCQVRAEREDKSPSLRYLSPYAIGYSDLDEYGRWTTIAPYGPVWIPAGVAVGWAPYRWGHWVFLAPWGWTWVDEAPWGFAPYHYGRWVHFGGYWGWCPGPYHPRPIWAPALVGWVGGAHWGMGLSFGIGGGVGWFPLGWGEPYIPYYRHSRGYFRNVNVTNTHITNITYITNNYYGGRHINKIHYVNLHSPHGITAVSTATFKGARPTRGVTVPVSAQALARGSVVNTVPVRPTRESMVGPGRREMAPPSAAFNHPVVRRMTPPITTHSQSAFDGQRRPMRSKGPALGGVNAPPATAADMGRPSRVFPRPPQRTAPVAVATEQSPRRLDRVPESLKRPSADPVATPSRPSTTIVPDAGPGGPHAYEASRVPRPGRESTPGAVAPPATYDRPQRGTTTIAIPRPTNAPAVTAPMSSERPARTATLDVPRPTSTPASVDRPAHAVIPEVSRPTSTTAPSHTNVPNISPRPARTDTYVAPPPTKSAPPAHTTQPSAAPRVYESGRNSAHSYSAPSRPSYAGQRPSASYLQSSPSHGGGNTPRTASPSTHGAHATPQSALRASPNRGKDR